MRLIESGTPPVHLDVRKIVVFRANGLGDCIFALPALWSLRTAYSDADIALAALPWHREFLRHGHRRLTASSLSPSSGCLRINAGGVWRTQHRPVLSCRLECPECGVNCITSGCEHRSSFVADVPVHEVLAHVLDLLARTDHTGIRRFGSTVCNDVNYRD